MKRVNRIYRAVNRRVAWLELNLTCSQMWRNVVARDDDQRTNDLRWLEHPRAGCLLRCRYSISMRSGLEWGCRIMRVEADRADKVVWQD